MNEIAWQAPEFVHYPKGIAWFATLFAAALAFVVFFLWKKDFLTAILFLLLGVVIYYYSKKKPRLLHTRVTGSALEWGETRVPMAQVKSFWIIYNPPDVKVVNFETGAYLNRVLTIQLGGTDPVKLREFLLQYLPEQLDREEDLSQQIARKLRF